MATQNRRLPGASMNKETWQAISTEGKVTWDKLTEADKKQILQYATQRAAAKPTLTTHRTPLSHKKSQLSVTATIHNDPLRS